MTSTTTTTARRLSSFIDSGAGLGPRMSFGSTIGVGGYRAALVAAVALAAAGVGESGNQDFCFFRRFSKNSRNLTLDDF